MGSPRVRAETLQTVQDVLGKPNMGLTNPLTILKVRSTHSESEHIRRTNIHQLSQRTPFGRHLRNHASDTTGDPVIYHRDDDPRICRFVEKLFIVKWFRT